MTQRRQTDLDRVEPEKEIFPKPAVLDVPLQVRVGGAQNSGVDLLSAGRADPLEYPSLQGPEDFGLLGARQITDHVEKKTAAVRQLEAANPIGPRVGKRPFDVSKHFALEQVFRDPAHVDADQRAGRTR